MRSARAAVVALALAALSAGEATLAIVGATAIDPASGTVTPDAVVLIADGRIAAVGAGLAVPAGAEVLRAEGRWLIPGLVDAHIHFFQSGGLYTRPDALDLTAVVPYAREVERVRAGVDGVFARYLRCGVTAVADVGGPMWNFAVRQRASQVLAPRVAVAGPLISSWKPPRLEHEDAPIIAVASVEEALAEVRRQAPHRPDFVKLWWIVGRDGGGAEAFAPIARSVVEECHRAGLRVAVHATELATARAALAVGADILVHSVDDAPLDEAFLRELVARRVAYCSTAIVHGGYGAVFDGSFRPTREELAWADPFVLGTLADLDHLPARTLPGWLRGLRAEGGRLADDDGPIAARNCLAAVEAGALVALGTDAGNIGTLHGASVFREIAALAAAGMPPMAVLRCATRGGAELMGRAHDLGSLAPGMLADLVVLDGDPLADLADCARIHRVVLGGRVLDPADLLPADPAEVAQRALNALNAGDADAVAALASDGAREAVRAFAARAIGPHRRLVAREVADGVARDRYALAPGSPRDGEEIVTWRFADGRLIGCEPTEPSSEPTAVP